MVHSWRPTLQRGCRFPRNHCSYNGQTLGPRATKYQTRATRPISGMVSGPLGGEQKDGIQGEEDVGHVEGCAAGQADLHW